MLIATVLRHHGAAGASPEDLWQVVSWARSTWAEAQQLQHGQAQKARGTAGGRGRRPSQEAVAQAQCSELNTLLLERVLSGQVGLDVRGGQRIFVQAGSSRTGSGNSVPGPSPGDWTHRITADTAYYLDGPQQARPPEGTFPRGTRVRLVQESGSYSLVTSESAISAYVASDRLEPLEE